MASAAVMIPMTAMPAIDSVLVLILASPDVLHANDVPLRATRRTARTLPHPSRYGARPCARADPPAPGADIASGGLPAARGSPRPHRVTFPWTPHRHALLLGLASPVAARLRMCTLALNGPEEVDAFRETAAQDGGPRLPATLLAPMLHRDVEQAPPARMVISVRALRCPVPRAGKRCRLGQGRRRWGSWRGPWRWLRRWGSLRGLARPRRW